MSFFFFLMGDIFSVQSELKLSLGGEKKQVYQSALQSKAQMFWMVNLFNIIAEAELECSFVKSTDITSGDFLRLFNKLVEAG